MYWKLPQRSFFWRIQDAIICFWDLLTFRARITRFSLTRFPLLRFLAYVLMCKWGIFALLESLEQFHLNAIFSLYTQFFSRIMNTYRIFFCARTKAKLRIEYLFDPDSNLVSWFCTFIFKLKEKSKDISNLGVKHDSWSWASIMFHQILFRFVSLYVHYSFKVKIKTVTILQKTTNLNKYDYNSVNADCGNLEVKVET